MKKAIVTTGLLSILTLQGCGLHYHPPHHPIGISSASKGAPGEISSPGRMGAAKAQRKQEIETQLSIQPQQGSSARRSTVVIASAGETSQAGHTYSNQPQPQPQQNGSARGPAGVTTGAGETGQAGHTHSSQPQPMIGPAFVGTAFLELLKLCIIHKC